MVKSDHFFFGDGDRQLYGVFEAPAGSPAIGGVVLCYPVGQEAIRAHRSYAVLSKRLVGQGLAVMRFDYFGTGDSAGEASEGSMELWTENVQAAVEQVKRRTGLDRIGFIGGRLGANLALRHVAKHKGAGFMVLWDPVLNGQAYLNSLQELHHEFATQYGSSTMSSQNGFEALGFSFSDVFKQELEAEVLTFVPRLKTLLVSSVGELKGERLKEKCPNYGRRVELENLEEPNQIWVKRTDIGKGLVPMKTITSMEKWVSNEFLY